MIRRLLKILSRTVRGEPSFVEIYFKRGQLLCTACGATVDPEGLPALTSVACPECDTQLFVPLLISDFLLFEPAGAGGMASVYKAYRKDQEDELFAVKILKEEFRDHAESVEEFLTEAQIHSRVPDHPNLVRYVDSGHEHDHYYYAMNYVIGQRLLRRIESKGRLPQNDSLRITYRVLEVMHHIAAHGFLYRDVNAANIILVENDEPIVMDFGLTLPLEEARKPIGKVREVLGTPEYLPPERLLGSGETESSTIYSLGLLLYFMLTGESLMKARTVQSMAKKHVARLRVAGATIPEDITNPVIDLLEKMSAQEADDRYASFAEAAEAVHAILASEEE